MCRPLQICAGGGERACGGVRAGGRALAGRASLVKAGCGMAAPLAKAHDYGVGRSRKTGRSFLSPLSASRASTESLSLVRLLFGCSVWLVVYNRRFGPLGAVVVEVLADQPIWLYAAKRVYTTRHGERPRRLAVR